MNYRIIYWPFHSALTLPLDKPTIFTCKDHWKTWIVHEEYHVKQIERMVRWKYLKAHIAARLRSRSIWAKNEPIEKEAYDAQKKYDLSLN